MAAATPRLLALLALGCLATLASAGHGEISLLNNLTVYGAPSTLVTPLDRYCNVQYGWDDPIVDTYNAYSSPGTVAFNLSAVRSNNMTCGVDALQLVESCSNGDAQGTVSHPPPLPPPLWLPPQSGPLARGRPL